MITERAYYFDIARPRRFRHLIFFSLPQNTWIFEEVMETFLDFFDYKSKKPKRKIIEDEDLKRPKGRKHRGSKSKKYNKVKIEKEDPEETDDEDDDFVQNMLLLFVRSEVNELERVVGTKKAREFIDSTSSFKSLSVFD